MKKFWTRGHSVCNNLKDVHLDFNKPSVCVQWSCKWSFFDLEKWKMVSVGEAFTVFLILPNTGVLDKYAYVTIPTTKIVFIGFVVEKL